MSIKPLYPLLLCAFSAFIHGCTSGVAGVETTNGVITVAGAGSIEGTVPPYARTFLFDTGYVPFIDSGIGLGTSADDAGSFSITVRPGTYNLVVLDEVHGRAGTVREIVIGESGGSGDSTRFLQLTGSGSIAGSVRAGASGRVLLYLAGMCYHRVLSGPGEFSFEGIPPGTYVLRTALLGEDGSKRIDIRGVETVTVRSGKQTTVGEIAVE